MRTIGIKKISIIFLLIPIVLAQNIEKTHNIIFDYTIYTYPAKIEVLNKNQNIEIGMSADTWILDFGKIYVGMISKKYINISSNEDVKVILRINGNISSILKFEKNNFLLEKNHNYSIPFFAEPKKPGNYTGEIKIIFKKIKYPFLNWLIKCV